jgi:hypothetical protein
MVPQPSREQAETTANADDQEWWPLALTRPTSVAPTECLPAALRTVLTELEQRFGPVTVLITTHPHAANHRPGSNRAIMHFACKAVDVKTSHKPNKVRAYLRSRREVGRVATYRNGLVHFELNANYKPVASKPDP